MEYGKGKTFKTEQKKRRSVKNIEHRRKKQNLENTRSLNFDLQES